MIISPCSSHAFGIPVVWDNVVVICEFFVADGTLLVLLHNLSVQQLPHLCPRSEFTVSPRVMRVFNALHAEPDQPGFVRHRFPAAAGERFVNRTIFIATQFHRIAPG
jgi:hypothetical protein